MAPKAGIRTLKPPETLLERLGGRLERWTDHRTSQTWELSLAAGRSVASQLVTHLWTFCRDKLPSHVYGNSSCRNEPLRHAHCKFVAEALLTHPTVRVANER